MRSFRDWVVFLTGAQAFHTLSHIIIAFSVNLPLATKYVTLTSTMNSWAIAINALITVVLFWIAKKLHS